MIEEEKRRVKRLKRLRAYYLQLKIDGNLTPSEKRFIRLFVDNQFCCRLVGKNLTIYF